MRVNTQVWLTLETALKLREMYGTERGAITKFIQEAIREKLERMEKHGKD
jgi:hypothetical protein